MFGDQAVRLLRESWGGVIQPDVNGNPVERGATALAEELYAMFDDDIPQAQNAPLTVTRTNPNAAAPLTIANDLGGSTLNVNGGNTTFAGGGAGDGTFNVTLPQGAATIAAGTTAIPGTTVAIGATGAAGAPGFGVSTGSSPPDPPKRPPPDPFHLELPPLDDITVGGVNIAAALDALGLGGSAVTLGRVVSGTGARYQVALFGNGIGQPATATVTATVPQILASETIPAGTWIAAVVRSGTGTAATYAFQPPVWL